MNTVNFSLHPKQALAFQSDATEILYGGSAGSAKSHLLRVAAIYLCHAVPGLQVYLFRRTYPDLIANHLDGPTGFPMMLAPWVRSGYAKINYSHNEITIGKSGSKVKLRHCQYEKDRFNYQGAEIHVLLIDELTQFPETIYRYLRSRCRKPEGKLKIPDGFYGQIPRIIAATNPGGIGHTWVKQTWIDRLVPMQILEMPADEGGMHRQFIPALLEDNPSIDTEEYASKLEGLGSPALVNAMRYGLWDIDMGGMFTDVWDRDVHIVPPFRIPQGWRVDRAFDWGSSRPFSVGWWAESNGETVRMADGKEYTYPRGTLFYVAEWYGWNGTANEGSRMISTQIASGILDRENAMTGALLNGNRVHPGPADSSIFDVVDGRCIADDMATIGVRWNRANKGPGSRRNGWELMRRRLLASMKAKTGPMEEPGLFVFDTARHFIRTIPNLPRSERDPEDVDTDAEDHVADQVRYRCLAAGQELKSTRFKLA